MSQAAEAKPQPMSVADAARRAALRRLFACEGNPSDPRYGEAFMRTYLPHYAERADGSYIRPAEWHPDFDAQVYETLGQGVRKVFLAPRGYAKSTKVSLVTPLICLARQLKRYILLIEETGPQAKQAMSQILHELDTNERLLKDFPHLQRAYVKGRPVADRDDDVVFQSGARLQSLGAGGSLRGRRNRQQRPDLVLIDDLENDELVRTRYQRDKLDEWVSSALLGALVPESDVYMVGTLLHHDAVLARLMTRGAPWQAYRYEAVSDRGVFDALMQQVDQAITDLTQSGDLERGAWDDDLIAERIDPAVLQAADATSTWPTYWSALALARKRKEMGVAAFSRELLHDPISDDDKLFPREHMRWRDMRRRLHAAEHGEFQSVKLRIAVDPAVGEKRTHDYTAIAVGCQVERGTYDVLDVLQGRWSQEGIIKKLAEKMQEWQRYSPVIVAETVQAQAWLAQALRKHGFAVKEVSPQRDKQLRAAPVAVLYENHQVFHDEALRDGEFEQQLNQFPVAEHDDMVDANVYLLAELAGKPTPTITLI